MDSVFCFFLAYPEIGWIIIFEEGAICIYIVCRIKKKLLKSFKNNFSKRILSPFLKNLAEKKKNAQYLFCI